MSASAERTGQPFPAPGAGCGRSVAEGRGSVFPLCLIVFLAAAALNLAWLGRAPLFDTTEARHAEVAREFAADGHWLVPTLNGWPHLTKPPLTDWLAAAGILVFGPNEFGARFAGALLAALGAALVAGFARDLSGNWRAGLAAGVLYASCPLYLALGRTISIDAILATLAIGCYWLLWRLAREECRRPKLCAAALAALLGLGFLAKGHIMALLVAPGLLWLALGPRRRAFRHLALSPAPLVFLGLALPWFVYIAGNFPNWTAEMIGAEFGERVAGEGSGSYLPGKALLYFLAGALPALPLAVAAVLGSWRSGADRTAAPEPRTPDPEPGLPAGAISLLLLWAALPLLAFSLFKVQRPNYVMPLVPAAAILAGVAWGRLAAGWAAAGRLARAMVVVSAGLAGALGLLALLALALGPSFFVWTPQPGTLAIGWAAGAAVGLGGLLGLGLLLAGRPGFAPAPLLVAAAGLWALSLAVTDEYNTRNSSRRCSARARSLAALGEPVMLYRDYIHSVGFGLGRRVTVADPARPIRERVEARAAHWPGCRGETGLIGTRRLVELSRAGRVWLVLKSRKERDLAGLAESRRLALAFERLDPDLTVACMGPALPELRP